MAGDLETQGVEVHACAKAVLDYWFDELRPEQQFAKDDALDAEIARRFGHARNVVLASGAAGWRDNPDALLAAVILLDQFSRNIFRGHRFSFIHDPLALSLTMSGLAFKEDQHLTEAERVFFYLPLEHSEALKDQQMSVKLFEQLARESRPAFKDFCEMTLDYARKHLEVVERFGRFPHRNAVLRRASTREEQAYLSQPGAGF